MGSVEPYATEPQFLSIEDVHALTVRALGLDPGVVDLTAPETIAAVVRRAASLVAPCAKRTLRETTLRALEGLISDETARPAVDATIEALVDYGDLLELPVAEESAAGTMLYLAPPTFVWREEGLAFLLGGFPDGAEMLPEDLRARVHYASHTRRIYATPGEDLPQRLRGFGLIELAESLWLAPPRRATAQETLIEANRALDKAPSRGEVPGLVILDPSRPVAFYRGRWTSPSGHTGRFVARREQRYGSDLWCYVEVIEGRVTRLLDLPRGDWRGCDEAWYLQLAIDAVAGHPQRYRRRRSSPPGWVVVDFFSPLPMWARRRWDVLGEVVPPESSLFAYRLPATEFDGERRFLHDVLWLEETA